MRGGKKTATAEEHDERRRKEREKKRKKKKEEEEEKKAALPRNIKAVAKGGCEVAVFRHSALLYPSTSPASLRRVATAVRTRRGAEQKSTP